MAITFKIVGLLLIAVPLSVPADQAGVRANGVWTIEAMCDADADMVVLARRAHDKGLSLDELVSQFKKAGAQGGELAHDESIARFAYGAPNGPAPEAYREGFKKFCMREHAATTIKGDVAN